MGMGAGRRSEQTVSDLTSSWLTMQDKKDLEKPTECSLVIKILYCKVLKAFRKSAKIISVTSPFFMAWVKSSHILMRTVQVDCPLPKPDKVSLKVEFNSQKPVICLATGFSKTFDKERLTYPCLFSKSMEN